MAAPLLRRAVQETGLVIRNCGLRPDELAGLFLVVVAAAAGGPDAAL